MKFLHRDGAIQQLRVDYTNTITIIRAALRICSAGLTEVLQVAAYSSESTDSSSSTSEPFAATLVLVLGEVRAEVAMGIVSCDMIL